MTTKIHDVFSKKLDRFHEEEKKFDGVAYLGKFAIEDGEIKTFREEG